MIRHVTTCCYARAYTRDQLCNGGVPLPAPFQADNDTRSYNIDVSDTRLLQ